MRDVTDTLDALNAAMPSPADPARFRTDYRRQRWYVDPLPACEVAEASGDKWPALSTIKRAWNSTFRKTWAEDGNTYDLDPLRVALYADENWSTLAALPRAERVPLLTRSAKADLDEAAKRGTAVHAALDLLLGGDEKGAAEVCHPDYWSTVRRMVTDLGLDLVHAERVAICRTHGWGGTFDGIATIDDKAYLIDWKTRGADSKHGAYEAEAAQLGGYSLADYMVVEGDNGEAQRVKLPALAGGLVISIKPDSWEAYPVDLTAGAEACRELKSAWATIANGKSYGRKAIGKGWTIAPPADGVIEPPPQPVPADRSEWITQRIETLVMSSAAKAMLAESWPAGLAKRGPWDDDQIATIVAVLEPIETAVEAPFPHRDPAEREAEAQRHAEEAAQAAASAPRAFERPTPDDGDIVDAGDVAALKVKATTLDGPRAEACHAWRAQGRRHGSPWGGVVDGAWTQRCWSGNRAALLCAQHLLDPDDPEVGETYVRAALSIVIGEELQPAWTTGAVIGSLSVEEAERLADIASAAAAQDAKTWRDLASAAA